MGVGYRREGEMEREGHPQFQQQTYAPASDDVHKSKCVEYQ
jgi:hypothetical protein